MSKRTIIEGEHGSGILIVRSLLFAFLLLRLPRTWADPDLWGHVRFGADIIKSGLARSDPYSFASNVPWINHEWLSEVVMYSAWSAAGGAGLIALKMALIGTTLIAIAAVLRADNVPAPVRDLLMFATIVGTWSRAFVLRPQIFSILAFALLLWILRAIERGRTRLVWFIPLLFAVWVNLHGGWIVGVGVFALWAVATLRRADDVQILRRSLALCAVISIVGTLANPYGIEMWRFLMTTVRVARPNINDWRPLFESGSVVVIPWGISVGLAIYAVVRGRRRISVSHLLVVVTLGLAAIRVNRLDAFFTLSVVMLLGREIPASRERAHVPVRWTPRLKLVAGALVVVAVAGMWTLRSDLTCVKLTGPWMPERESGAFIAENRLAGRLLTWFDWGQYAIWHFAPRLRVSLDGRRETVYSDAYVAEHVRLYFEPDASSALLQQLAPDYAWLPNGLPLVRALERQQWTRLFSGPISVVLARRAMATHPAAVTTAPCFPGP